MPHAVKIIYIIYLLIFLPSISFAEDSAISSIFKKHGVEGAIVISSLDGHIVYIHNNKRASVRYHPASTFKIVNTLIALEEGVIESSSDTIKWDGIDKGWKSWNKDQTLRSAFSLSCIWCYQEFAKKIGSEKYIKYLNDIEYGNKKVGSDVTTFWLKGDLKISPIEQIDVLRNIYLEKMPFHEDYFKILKDIMVVDKTPKYTLRAKTGTYKGAEDKYGWYVGYIEIDNEVWLFSSNIKLEDIGDSQYRKKLVVDSLKVKGIM